MNFGFSLSDESKEDDITFDEIPFQLEPERVSKKRSANDLSAPSTDDHANQISMPVVLKYVVFICSFLSRFLDNR